MKRKSFILYLDLLSSLDMLNDEQAGRLFKAIKAYHLSVAEGATQESVAEFEGYMKNFVTELAFQPFRVAFERDAERYQGVVERNRKNGSKGGRKRVSPPEENKPKQTQTNPVGYLETQINPEKPKQSHNDNDNDNVNVNDKKNNNLVASIARTREEEGQSEEVAPPLDSSSAYNPSREEEWHRQILADDYALEKMAERVFPSRGIESVEMFKELADEVMAEWRWIEKVHINKADFQTHLLSQVTIKAREQGSRQVKNLNTIKHGNLQLNTQEEQRKSRKASRTERRRTRLGNQTEVANDESFLPGLPGVGITSEALSSRCVPGSSPDACTS